MINKIIKQVLIIFLGLYTTVSTAQTERPERVLGDEFIRVDEGLDDIIAQNPCGGHPDCNDNLSDISFGYDLSAALTAHNLIKRAYERRLNAWFSRQHNVLKEEIEEQLNNSNPNSNSNFPNYETAKKAYYINLENKNIRSKYRAVAHTHASKMRLSEGKKKASVRNLKMLNLRKREIENGRINNSALGNLKINNTPIRNIRTISRINDLYQQERNIFDPNAFQAHVSKYIYLKTIECAQINTEANREIINLALNKQLNHYNSFNRWEQLDLMQGYLNNVRALPPLMYTPISPIDVSDYGFIDRYVKSNRDGGISPFNPEYFRIIAHQIASNGSTPLHVAYSIGQQAQLDAQEQYINGLLNDLNLSDLRTQNLIQELGLENHSLEANWLYDNSSLNERIEDFLDDYDRSEDVKSFLKESIKEIKNRNAASLSEIISLYSFRKQLEYRENNASWTPNEGTYMNRTALKYTHSHRYPNGDMQYLLESGGQLFVSQTRRPLNYKNYSIIANTEDNGPYHYISFPGSNGWNEVSLFSFDANCLSCELHNLSERILVGGLRLTGRYIVPVEDIIILIEGKDFDGNASSQVRAGVLILVDLGGGKFFKAFKALPAGIDAWRIAYKTASGGTTKLIFETINGIIQYGSRSQLARVLGTAGTSFRAHHIIPWRFNNNPIVQAASRYKKHWHPNSTLNGKAVEYARHSGSHGTYDIWVQNKLNDMINRGLANNPERAYYELKRLSELLKRIIDENPGVRINDLPLP